MTTSTKITELLAMKPEDARRVLDETPFEDLLSPAKIVSREDAELVKCAIYLKHGFLEEGHRIAQQVETPTGSYWHGIMHRHEGDIGNAHYWYQRAGAHPVLQKIGGYPESVEAQKEEFDLLLAHTLEQVCGEA